MPLLSLTVGGRRGFKLRPTSAALPLTRRWRTFGDSRAQQFAGPPDQFDTTNRSLRTSTANQPSHHACIPWFYPGSVIVADGGVSGEASTGWNNGARANGKTFSAVMSIAADGTFIQYGTNDVQNGVSTVGTITTVHNTVTTALQALITQMIATKASHEYIFWETIIQRDAALGYLNTNAANKRDCVDQINTTMLAWIAALNNPKVVAIDLRALTNVGNVTTGAYATTPGILGDGIHAGHRGSMIIAAYEATVVNTYIPTNGLQPMYRASGANLLQSISSGPVSVTSNGGTLGTTSYATFGGLPCVTAEMTPAADNAHRVTIEMRANVGSNGAGGPPANTVAAGDKVKFRCRLHIDDGAGGVPAVSSISAYFFVSYIGGPALQQITNGNIADTTGRGTNGTVLTDIPVEVGPLTLTNGSADIAAGATPSGAGMRVQFIVYGLTNGQKIRVRVVDPEIRKVT